MPYTNTAKILSGATSTDINHLAETTAQGVVQDNQYTEQLAQGVVQDKQKLTQDTLEDLLAQILTQLKILTLHQETASDEVFTEEDIVL